MIELTRTNGDVILVNPDNIALIEPIRGGAATRLTVGRDTTDVMESIEQIKRVISVTPWPPIEVKADAATPVSEEEAAEIPPAELEVTDSGEELPPVSKKRR